MSHRRQPSSFLSSKILMYLIEQGYRQQEIAEILGVTAGFISLVKSQQRSFTLDHLERLAEAQREIHRGSERAIRDVVAPLQCGLDIVD